ncbi:phosphodiester glycosidase family protein [Leptolyngbya sp. PCC 6406]|uniref:phosphodiester glycosidase family protein n=1 Tax=Leptolyngbya sp. PCC 6406 TaxID=1173264 RepID=UPI0002F8D16E|nr:phosphodiester glycosidase family protein [Leptolyngbya sp. PCC 6406]
MPSPGYGAVLILLAMGMTTMGCSRSQHLEGESAMDKGPSKTIADPVVTPEIAAEVTYNVYDLPSSQVHVVTIPPESGYRVQVAVAEGLNLVQDLAPQVGAIAAVNAGFFDPQNGLTTSYITIGGSLIADPRQNLRLMENPDLQSYLDAILDRSEFRIYDCGDRQRYGIMPHSAPIPEACTLDAAVGAGPQLLPAITAYEEGFLADNPAGEVVRDALGSRYANARSAIGLKPDGTVVFAIAAQRLDQDAPTGLTLEGMAEFLKTLGVTAALNLDGGSSSSLFFKGTTHYGRLNAQNQFVERPIKSILFVK